MAMLLHHRCSQASSVIGVGLAPTGPLSEQADLLLLLVALLSCNCSSTISHLQLICKGHLRAIIHPLFFFHFLAASNHRCLAQSSPAHH